MVRNAQGKRAFEAKVELYDNDSAVCLIFLRLKRYNRCKPCTTYNVQARSTIQLSASALVRGTVHESI